MAIKVKLKGRHFFLPLSLMVGILLVAFWTENSQSCSANYRADREVTVNSETIKVEAVKTPVQRTKGLGGRECIGESQGMLFVFNKPGSYPFWMKDMRFAIDIVWLNSQKQVVKIQANVRPETYPQTFTNDQPAQYVLELAAGRATPLGIKEGAVVNF